MKIALSMEAIDQLSIDQLWDVSMMLQTFADYAAKRAETLAMERMDEDQGEVSGDD